MSTKTKRQAQDQIKTVAGATGQREWMKAFLPFAMRSKYPASVVATAMALFEFHFNRKTSQCDPGEDALAIDIGRDQRTIRRAMKLLKDDNWLQLQRRGDDNAQIIFTITDRTTSVLSLQPTDRTQNTDRPDTKRVPTGQYSVLSNEHLNTEHKSAAPAARSARMDRPVYTCNSPSISVSSARLPALEQDHEDDLKLVTAYLEKVRRMKMNGATFASS